MMRGRPLPGRAELVSGCELTLGDFSSTLSSVRIRIPLGGVIVGLGCVGFGAVMGLYYCAVLFGMATDGLVGKRRRRK